MTHYECKMYNDGFISSMWMNFIHDYTTNDGANDDVGDNIHELF